MHFRLGAGRGPICLVLQLYSLPSGEAALRFAAVGAGDAPAAPFACSSAAFFFIAACNSESHGSRPLECAPCAPAPHVSNVVARA